MGLIGIAAQAGWYAIATDRGTALGLGFYVINGGGVLAAVSTAVVPRTKD